ncbi:hypothetical protein OEZ85_005432 [Tetradesmus obliquus]|uniref:Conserved oligomeric Golgi complex subunit 7 n=1 Tax=Tetradesmus obliquus TaxID=3088 RepID=A0ABY8UIC9_TETOB|nr:hypothetical protein OEZ85_005432 [Tetradesmus obliquus]
MTDLAAFAEEGFDPKAWINESCAGKPPTEPLERFLAELEMRLQLGAEEVEGGLSEVCGAALRRVPFALQEVGRLRGDVGALQATARGLLGSVAADAEAAAASAAPLAALHTARTNMEAGCATLREAAELSGAFRRVEEVFAAGDLPRVADMLRSMARSLALVGDVPEFREGRGRLAGLEDRLQRRVEGRLADALQANASQEVSSLAALLLAVGRYNSLEAAYVASRMPLVSALWDEAAAMLAGGSAAAAAAAAGSGAGGLGGGWLLLLYNGLMGLLEGDAAWLAGCLPGQQRQLLVAAAVAAFEKLNKSLREKLAALHSSRLLAGLLGDALLAARRLRELLAAAAPAAAAPGDKDGFADGAVVLKLLRLALEPVEQQISRYTSLEEPVISAALSAPLPINTAAAANPKGPSSGSTADSAAAAAGDAEELEQDVAQKLAAAVSAAFLALWGVVERCMQLTGGTELPGLLASLDKQLAGYLQRLQAAVGIINGRYTRLAAAASPAADISVMLQLAAAASSRFMSLPAATVAGGALCEAISAAVYDALLAPVVAALAPLPGLPDWGGAGSGTGVMPGAGAVVPSFSAYPLPAVTAVGEYLMALPQQLEVLMGDEAAAAAGGGQEAAALQAEAAEGDELAAEWLDKVVRGAGLLYAEALLQIKSLSPSGGAQLAADAEYIANVMAALAVAPPPALVTAQLFAAAPADAFGSLAEGAVAGGSSDIKVLKAIAAMRGIEWSEAAAMAAAAASASQDSAAAAAAQQPAGDELL